jgi:gluconolactonase
MSVELQLVAGPFTFAEGPAYDGEGVLFTDIKNSRIMKYVQTVGHTTVFRTDTGEANGLMLDQEGRLYACEGGNRRMVRYEPDGGTTVLADKFEGKRLNSPNDLAIDNEGRIWFTDPRYGEKTDDLELDHQSVLRLTPPESEGQPWKIERITFDTTKPNGLLISPDQKTLYVAQSEYGVDKKRELRAYPIKDDGTVGEHTVLHTFSPHRGIDGMCLDTEGNIVATAGWRESGPGPMVYVFSPDGTVQETIPVPVDRPTNCTFGDEDLRSLYVTTADGSLYRGRTERQGLLHFPKPAG